MDDRPSGTATFLFTDVEGSTELLRRLRGRYGQVLADHQEVLQRAFTESGGREVDTRGDALFYVFPSASDAVLAAARGQQAIAAHEWPDGVDLKVRMGVHSGRAVSDDGRYTGLAVHRASRICTAAHGGQVVTSQTTYGLLEDEGEDLDGLDLRDLGEQRLKDFDRPIRLYQVDSPGLPTQFPPPRTLDTPPFVGREAELEQLIELRPPIRVRLGRRESAAVAAALLAAGVALTAFFLMRGGFGPDIVSNSLVQFDAGSGKVRSVTPVGLGPQFPVITPRAVWVVNAGSRSVSRIDSRTGDVNAIGSGACPGPWLASDGRGAVWVPVGCTGPTTALEWLNPRTGVGQLNIRIGKFIEGVASNGPFVYVATQALNNATGTNTLFTIAARCRRVVERRDIGLLCDGVAADRAYVATVHRSAAAVLLFDARDGGAPRRLTVLGRPTGVAFVGGALWVTSYDTGKLLKIDPQLGTTDAVVQLDKDIAFVAGSGNDVWVTNPVRQIVYHVDARRAAVVGTLKLHVASPVGVTVASGQVWLAVDRPIPFL